MSDFDFIKYQATVKDLKESVQEMEDAIDGLMFECGANGITDRAVGHLNRFNDAHKDAQKKQGAVGRLIIKEMAKK